MAPHNLASTQAGWPPGRCSVLPLPSPRRFRFDVCLAFFLCLCQAPLGALEAERRIIDFSHRQWGVAHGLADARVRGLAQSPDGYLWVATAYGLARFDGSRFTMFAPDTTPVLTQPGITCLLAQKTGALWVGTDGAGLVRHEAGRFTPEPQFPSTVIRCILEDHAGRIWVGTPDGIRVQERGVWRNPPTTSAPTNVSVLAIAEDRQQRLWLGTTRGLYGPIPADNSPIPRSDAVTDSVYALCGADEEGLWVGTDRGLFHIEGEHVTHFGRAHGLRDERVRALFWDSQGTLWVGTMTGVSRLRTDSIIREPPSPDLDSAAVRGFLSDQEGSLWVATDRGLHYWHDPAFATWSAREGLTDEEVISVVQGAEDRMLLGTTRAGLFELAGTKIARLPLALSSTTVATLLQDRSGGIWVGSRLRGLDYFKSDHAINFSTEQGMLDRNIMALHEAPEGRFWIGTAKGLNTWAEGKIAVCKLPGRSSLADGPSIRSITSSRDGILWLGTSGGLYSLSPAMTNHFTVQEGLPNNLVYCVQHDREDRVWIGTANGLACLLEDGWHAYPSTNLLSRHHVFWLVDDGLGSIWYTTPQTIFRVSKDDMLNHWRGRLALAGVRRRGFTQDDGLLSTECLGGRQPAGCQSRDGRLWFLTRKGVAVVDPATVSANTAPPKVHIETLLVNGRPIDLQGNPRLPAGTRMVELHYVGLSFVAPMYVQYAYRLEGVDRDWIRAETRRVANYANLGPGSYQFRVKAASADGQWNHTGATLAFVIEPHFYQTIWFYLAAGATAGGTALAWHRARLRQLRRRKEDLERLVQERTRALESQMAERLRLEALLQRSRQLEAVGQLAAGVAHYFNNLLMVIQGNASLARTGARLDLEADAHLAEVENASQHAAALVAQLLAFGRRRWQFPKPVDLAGMVREQARSLTARLPAAVECVLAIPPQTPTVLADRELIEQVFAILVANALDAMPGGGRLTIGVDETSLTPEEAARNPEARPGRFVVLTVADTGVGMSDEVLSRLFEPFFTTKDVGAGTGLGLAAAHGIVKQHEGWIQVQSAPGRGTTARVLLPLPAAPVTLQTPAQGVKADGGRGR